MNCALIFAAAVSVLPPFGLLRHHAPAQAAAKALSEKEKKEKIDTANAQLDGCSIWEKREKIIRHAIVEEGIHPDQLGNLSWNPLRAAVASNDIDFTRFLLEHGATPDCIRWSHEEPIFSVVKTVAMAQLLFDHGGNRVLAEPGKVYVKRGMFSLWRATLSPQHETALITWYADHGVDPNQSFTYEDMPGHFCYHQSSLLIECIEALQEMDGPDSKEKSAYLFYRIRLLMQLGAPLDSQLLGGKHYPDRNVAQLIKDKLDYIRKQYAAYLQKPELDPSRQHSRRQIQIDRLNEARNILIAASNRRQEHLKTGLSKILPVLGVWTLATNYYEPRYEELEAIPFTTTIERLKEANRKRHAEAP